MIITLFYYSKVKRPCMRGVSMAIGRVRLPLTKLTPCGSFLMECGSPSLVGLEALPITHRSSHAPICWAHGGDVTPLRPVPNYNICLRGAHRIALGILCAHSSSEHPTAACDGRRASYEAAGSSSERRCRPGRQYHVTGGSHRHTTANRGRCRP